MCVCMYVCMCGYVFMHVRMHVCTARAAPILAQWKPIWRASERIEPLHVFFDPGSAAIDPAPNFYLPRLIVRLADAAALVTVGDSQGAAQGLRMARRVDNGIPTFEEAGDCSQSATGRSGCERPGPISADKCSPVTCSPGLYRPSKCRPSRCSVPRYAECIVVGSIDGRHGCNAEGHGGVQAGAAERAGGNQANSFHFVTVGRRYVCGFGVNRRIAFARRIAKAQKRTTLSFKIQKPQLNWRLTGLTGGYGQGMPATIRYHCPIPDPSSLSLYNRSVRELVSDTEALRWELEICVSSVFVRFEGHLEIEKSLKKIVNISDRKVSRLTTLWNFRDSSSHVRKGVSCVSVSCVRRKLRKRKPHQECIAQVRFHRPSMNMCTYRSL